MSTLSMMTSPEYLTAEQRAVLTAAYVAYTTRGSMPRTEAIGRTAQSLTTLGLLVRFGRDNFSITRDGMQIAERMVNPAVNVKANATELAALLPEMLAFIDAAAAGSALAEKAARIRAILAGHYS